MTTPGTSGQPIRQNDGAYFTEMLYAWLSEDANGLEGIICVPHPEHPGAPLPLVGADLDRMKKFELLATLGAGARGSTAKLVRFERVETLMEVP